MVGTGFPNKSGPSRRFEIALCEPGEPVELRPELRNPVDPYAVAVYSTRDIQIGYVRAERAPMIRRAIQKGGVSAIFQSVESWGAAIRVHLDGTTPELPSRDDSRAYDWPPPGSEDADWWPDA